jgi:hypothetical protein
LLLPQLNHPEKSYYGKYLPLPKMRNQKERETDQTVSQERKKQDREIIYTRNIWY